MRTQLAFPITLLVSLALALMPAPWRPGWLRDVAEIARFPLRPFTHAGNALASWLRPAPTILDVTTGGAPQDLARLREELELAQQLYHEERQRVLELEEQLRQLQRIPESVRRWTKAAVFAYVTARSPGSPLGIVEVRVEPGVDVTLDTRTIAVYASVDLLGRVTGEPSGSIASILPIANPANEYVRGIVVPREDPLAAPDPAAAVHLAPTGTGAFTADLDRLVPVEIGDIVRISDRSWPRTAQMMVVGAVESVAPNDREPLRNTIVVRPRYAMSEVAYVTLIVEAAGGPEDAP